MAKEKSSKSKKDGAGSEQAILNLTIDGSFPEAEVREIKSSPGDTFQTPCSVSGLMAGVSGGSLGYIFGFAGYWLRYRLKGSLKASLTESLSSAKTFAVMSGLYAAVSCFMLRLRQKQDAWNGAVSGCATGLVLGWSGGPASAAQSCAMLGIFSYFLDGMSNGTDAAHAAAPVVGLPSGDGASSSHSHSHCAEGKYKTAHSKSNERKKEFSPVEMLLSPAMPLLQAVRGPCWGGRCGGGGSSGGRKKAFGGGGKEEEGGEALGCKIGGLGASTASVRKGW